jgi:hypothetical protein
VLGDTPAARAMSRIVGVCGIEILFPDCGRAVRVIAGPSPFHSIGDLKPVSSSCDGSL